MHLSCLYVYEDECQHLYNTLPYFSYTVEAHHIRDSYIRVTTLAWTRQVIVPDTLTTTSQCL